MARVQVHDNESIESAIRRFKRQVAREGIITDTKKHAFYLKPGERRRLKSQVARRRARKSLRKRNTHDESRAIADCRLPESNDLSMSNGIRQQFTGPALPSDDEAPLSSVIEPLRPFHSPQLH